MFYHDKRLQYHAKPDAPDPIFAKKLQEVLGGQWGEMSVMMNYLFQGWNSRGPKKYRDMILDIGTEEISHVEMLATMIARLLEGAPLKAQEDAARVPIVGAVMGGSDTRDLIAAAMNPQHAIVYAMTEDKGVRDMLSFLLARDTMHQNQWIAAIAELERDGLETTPVPSTFPQERELKEVSYQFWNMSSGTESADGSWASGTTPDGRGSFEYVESPQPMSEEPVLPPGDPRLHGTNPMPMPPVAG